MQLTKIHKDFYFIEDVFTDETLNFLAIQCIAQKNGKILEQGDTIRNECGINSRAQTMVMESLREPQQLIEEYFNKSAYGNSTQLWHDESGYINGLHKDHSPNLQANVQVYLNDGNKNMGTYIIVEEILEYSVPYKKNCGYLMFNPTSNLHGTKYPVEGKRLSLYQSYRLTEQPSPIW